MEKNSTDELYLANLYIVKSKEYICYSMCRTISSFLDYAIVRKIDNKICEDVIYKKQYTIGSSNEEGLIFVDKNLISLNKLIDKSYLSFIDLYDILNKKRKERYLEEDYKKLENIIECLDKEEIGIFINDVLDSCNDNECLIKEMFTKLEHNLIQREENKIRVKK